MNSLKRVNWLLFGVCLVYNLLDVWHTMLLLETGLIEEANPVMNYFIVNYGISSCFYIKIILFIILGFGLFKFHKEKTNGN